MIYPLTGLLIGAVTGGLMARSRGGIGKDMAQWAAVLGMMGFVVGMFVLIMIERSYS